MKVNLSRALTVDGKEYFAGEQFVSDAEGAALRGQDGVTFPDEGAPTPDGAAPFDFPRCAIGATAKKMAADLDAHMGVVAAAPEAADRPAKDKN